MLVVDSVVLKLLNQTDAPAISCRTSSLSAGLITRQASSRRPVRRPVDVVLLAAGTGFTSDRG